MVKHDGTGHLLCGYLKLEETATKWSGAMKKVTLIARLLLGLIFVGSGIAFFLVTPPPMEGAIADFFKGLMASQYFFYLLKGTEIVCGLLLLSGFFVPLALVILAPIILNILLVHAIMAPDGLPVAIVVAVLEIYLAFFSREYSPKLKPLFKMR
jgi:putative oxidoreductase